jgi:hypothetical protein
MKRSEALAALAREHHSALVLARRMQRGSRDDESLMTAAALAWQALLLPHFACEESLLLPAMRAAGEQDQVARTLAEHAELHALMARIEAGDSAAVASFGALLAAHIRFEDRELFVRAEALYDEATLLRLMRAE